MADKMYSDLERVLTALKSDNILYVPNAGNAGDSFIAHVTYQYFNRIGLRYEMGELLGVFPNRTIVCGGGGSLVPDNPVMINFIRRNLATCKKLIILPQTIRAYSSLLELLPRNSCVFCREQNSFEYVSKAAPHANVFLSHDLALAWDQSETKNQINNQSLGDYLDRILLTRTAKRFARVLVHRIKDFSNTGTLNAFRLDFERTDIKIPPSNIDVSQAFASDDMSPKSSLHTCFSMMTFLNSFKTVRTNRLHVGIMAALLGKEVHFYDNSYGKNRDVFTHSLVNFANVKWCG